MRVNYSHRTLRMRMFNGARTARGCPPPRPLTEHSPYAVWCHLNAPPARSRPSRPCLPVPSWSPRLPCRWDLILCPFPGTSASQAVTLSQPLGLKRPCNETRRKPAPARPRVSWQGITILLHSLHSCLSCLVHRTRSRAPRGVIVKA